MTVVLYIVGIVLFLIGISISIALHELGHLTPAKKFGVKVTHYMVGFGPTLFSFRRGETEYGIKAFPLGGFIAMPGMYPPEEATKSRYETAAAAQKGGTVAGVDSATLSRALREALAAQVIVADGDGYAFRHALIQEMVHDELLPSERAALHARYADALEARLTSQPELAAEVAEHRMQARDVPRAFDATARAYAHARETAAPAAAAATSAARSRVRCGGCGPTTSTCTSCTSRTGRRRSRRRSPR